MASGQVSGRDGSDGEWFPARDDKVCGKSGRTIESRFPLNYYVFVSRAAAIASANTVAKYCSVVEETGSRSRHRLEREQAIRIHS